MKLLVPVKMVPNPTIPVRIGDGSTTEQKPDLKNIELVINPFDEIAIEEAVSLRETGVAAEVVVVAVGPESWEAELRTALALGADRAIRIACDQPTTPLAIAHAIKAITTQEGAQLVICGRQGVDHDNGNIGPMTAALLGWGQATFVSNLKITDHTADITREVDGGVEQLAIPLPAVITADLRLNTPRYASLPNIMKARNKPLLRITPQELGIELPAAADISGYHLPPTRPPVVRLQNSSELVAILKAKGFLP